MANGTIYGYTGNKYIDAKIVWESAAEEDQNRSIVLATLYYKYNGPDTESSTTGTGTFTLNIGGRKRTDTRTLTITDDGWVMAVSGAFAIGHNIDGNKVITISATGSIPDTDLTSTSVSGTATLDTIVVPGTIDNLYCSTQYFNGELTFNWTVYNLNLYHRCDITFNTDGTHTAVKTINLGKSSDIQQYCYSVTLSEEELSIVYNKLPSETKGTLRFTLRTYSDSGYSTQVSLRGVEYYKDIALSIPNISDTQPTATMILSSVSSLSSPFNTLYIKGKSKVAVSFTNGGGRYGASVVSYSVDINGKTYGSPFISEYITADGDIVVKGTVTDSRGFSRTYTETVPFIPYTNPRILPASNEGEIVCERCDAEGNPTESGTYLKIKAGRSYSEVRSGGVQKNFCQIRYRLKPEGGSYSSWVTILAADSASDEVDTGALLGGSLLLTSSYTVQVGVIDTLGESNHSTIYIATDRVFLHKAGSLRSIGIGKYAEEENTVDIADDMTIRFRGDVIFDSETWISRTLDTAVIKSDVNSGRWGGTGCYYLVCAGGKHVCVAFNVSFTTSASAVRVEQEPIPLPPKYDVYALCPVGFSDGTGGFAMINVTTEGTVNINAVHKLPGASLSNGDTVEWTDGYIDYWI